MHDHSLCTCVYRILAGTFRMQSTGCTSSTTVVEDVLLARAENMRGLVRDRCERITSLAQISKRKHDNTHRKWFKEILVASVGMSACAFVHAPTCIMMVHHAPTHRSASFRRSASGLFVHTTTACERISLAQQQGTSLDTVYTPFPGLTQLSSHELGAICGAVV